ncbi:uncharacterized protein LOC110456836, partial [Mizuhopecten yessoensis]|uniref:uncharacterized protein LOC110456836 n=1 Tax=Mizuhopecten yessoensis TaxID=6573 RepID=UPI000B45A27A
MAVPVSPYYDAGNPAAVYPSTEMVVVPAEKECAVQEESPVGDFNVMHGYKPKQKKTSHTSVDTQSKRCFEKDEHKPNRGLVKYLNHLFERKKSKMQKKVKNLSSKEGIQKKMKHFILKMKCLRGEKTNQELKNANFEDTAVPDEVEQYDRSSVLSAEIGDMVIPYHTIVVPVENEDVMTRQYGVGNDLPIGINSYGDSQCLTDEDDRYRDVPFFPGIYSAKKDLSSLLDSQCLQNENGSFRNIHFFSDKYAAEMDLSSLLDQPNDWSRQYERVSKTVEADGLGSEMNDIEDNKCQETMLKEVASCKQSATIQRALPKAETLKSSKFVVQVSNAIQCTEDTTDYAAMNKTRVESQELKSSKKSHYKDETIDSDKK